MSFAWSSSYTTPSSTSAAAAAAPTPAASHKNRLFSVFQSFSARMGCVNGRQRGLSEDDLDFIARNTAVTREEVDAQYQNFLQRHPDGKINKKDFASMMRQCYPDADTEKLEKHIFRMYDANHDGKIDFKEFMIVLYIMSNGSAEENLRQIFRIFDINDDGSISIKELKKIVKDLFHLLKKDGDPEKESEELLAETAFKEMDANSDGKVTIDEFVGACMKQKEKENGSDNESEAPETAAEKFTSLLALRIIDVFVSE